MTDSARGSQFWLRLPFRRPAQHSGLVGQGFRPAAGLLPGVSGLTILYDLHESERFSSSGQKPGPTRTKWHWAVPPVLVDPAKRSVPESGVFSEEAKAPQSDAA